MTYQLINQLINEPINQPTNYSTIQWASNKSCNQQTDQINSNKSTKMYYLWAYLHNQTLTWPRGGAVCLCLGFRQPSWKRVSPLHCLPAQPKAKYFLLWAPLEKWFANWVPWGPGSCGKTLGLPWEVRGSQVREGLRLSFLSIGIVFHWDFE